jgi:hypothetical protein
MGVGGVRPDRDLPGRSEILHESARTRVTRLFLHGRTVIRKQPLGPDAPRRLRHELAILERLHGVARVAQLLEAPRYPDSIVLEDVPGPSAAPAPGWVRLTAVRQLPALLAAQATVLSAVEITRVAEHLAEQMPSAISIAVPRKRQSVVGVPVRPEPLPADPGAEPDALFDVPALAEQLAKAASATLVDWMGFLHPGQTRLVRRSYAGPARVRGPAGTGKSVRTLPIHRQAAYERLSPATC